MIVFKIGSIRCFNPRICKRCDSYSLLYASRSKVSIHASVKDATFLLHYRSHHK